MIKRKNKKAQVGESLQDIVGIVIILTLLIIFFVISKALWNNPTVQTQNFIKDIAKENQEVLSVQAWLQKSVTIAYDNQEQTMSIAELAKLSKINPLYKTILEDEASKAFGADYKIIFNQAQAEGSTFYIPSNETLTITIQKQG